jgi:hypothetical protein
MLPALLVGAAMLALSAAPAAAQPPVPGTPTAIDGPTDAIVSPSGLGVSIARDGTGGLVYLKATGGTPHVFVSRLVGGAFQSPVQVDLGLGGSSSQPVIAAGNDGLLLIGFINSGQLYVVDGNAAGQFAAPLALASGAENPAISITNFGKAYIAFAVADGGGHDVRTAYYYNGSWALEGPPLNAVSPADNAGTGTGRPDVAAAGDGIAIVVWGEDGHIYSRKVWGTNPSVADEQADAPPAGCSESSANDPVAGAGGTSSYAPVAFHAVLNCGGPQEQRVLVNRLHGSVYDGVAEADGLSPSSPDGAEDPQMAVAEYGQGWVTAASTLSGNLMGASLGNNGAFTGGVTQVNSLPGSTPLLATPAIAGLHANLIAWQQEPGSGPGGDIRYRFAPDGTTLGPETVVSSPTGGPTDATFGGPTDATDGLAAAGDTSGDVAIAWLQGSPGAMQVMVNQLFEPPGGFSASKALAYSRTTQPVLAWTRPRGWGPMKYTLSVDAAQVGQTYANSSQVPAPLSNGPHGWQVTATNPAGQQSRAPAATVFVDTVAPHAGVKLLGRARPGSRLRVRISYRDRPPAGQPGYDASGVATVLVRWGDGTVVRLRPGTHLLTHLYRHGGRFRITLAVRDRAGNLTRVAKLVKVSKRGPGRSTTGGRRP